MHRGGLGRHALFLDGWLHTSPHDDRFGSSASSPAPRHSPPSSQRLTSTGTSSMMHAKFQFGHPPPPCPPPPSTSRLISLPKNGSPDSPLLLGALAAIAVGLLLRPTGAEHLVRRHPRLVNFRGLGKDSTWLTTAPLPRVGGGWGGGRGGPTGATPRVPIGTSFKALFRYGLIAPRRLCIFKF